MVMASNDPTADENLFDITSLHSPPSRPLPHTRRQSCRVATSDVNSSSYRIRNRYKSAFIEIGLDGAAETTNCNMRNLTPTRPGSRVRWRSQVEIHEVEQPEERDMQPAIPRAVPSKTWHQYGSSAAVISRLSFIAVVLAIMIPVLHMSPLLYAGPTSIGAAAGPVAPRAARYDDLESAQLLPRQDNPVDACLRWSHQAAVINGTLYLYGGRAKADSNQASNTWSE